MGLLGTAQVHASNHPYGPCGSQTAMSIGTNGARRPLCHGLGPTWGIFWCVLTKSHSLLHLLFWSLLLSAVLPGLGLLLRLLCVHLDLCSPWRYRPVFHAPFLLCFWDSDPFRFGSAWRKLQELPPQLTGSRQEELHLQSPICSDCFFQVVIWVYQDLRGRDVDTLLLLWDMASN